MVFADMAGGNFSGWTSLGTTPGWTLVGAGDINGDGSADVVIQNASGRSLYTSTSGGQQFPGDVSGWINIANVPGWQVRGVADFNADGFADVLIQQASGTNQVVFADMHNGMNNGFTAATTGLPADYRVVGVGDVNNDGYTDVIVQQQSTGITSYAAQGPAGFDHWGNVANVGTHWHAM